MILNINEELLVEYTWDTTVDFDVINQENLDMILEDIYKSNRSSGLLTQLTEPGNVTITGRWKIVEVANKAYNDPDDDSDYDELKMMEILDEIIE